MSNLVIVESPANAKTIQKYLGKGYDVIASMGHIRDLPKSKLGVDVENGFQPQYTDMKGKEDVIKKLKEHAKKCDHVYLATDPDREGEAISWHIAQLLHLDMNADDRVEFNEITRSGIQAGMSNPHKIDLDLVNARRHAGFWTVWWVISSARSCGKKSAADCPPVVCSRLPCVW